MAGAGASSAQSSDIGARIACEVRDIGIPPRPAILDRIGREMNKDEPDFKVLATAIGSDVGIVAGLIRTVNSPYYGSHHRVRSVNEALMTLGLDVVSRTIAGLALRQMYPHMPSLDRFWNSSALIARLSGWLSQTIEGIRVRPDDAYTFGLFRDCGIPVLLNPFPEYRAVLTQANEEAELSFTAVEEAAFGVNHAAIGAALAEGWLLPDELALAIRHHHNLAALDEGNEMRLPPTVRTLIALSHLAEHLIQQHTGLSQTKEWLKMGDASLQLLAMGEAQLATLRETCGPVIDSES